MDALAGYGSSEEDSDADKDALQVHAGSKSGPQSLRLHASGPVPTAPARPTPTSAPIPASPAPLPSAALLFSSAAPSQCAQRDPPPHHAASMPVFGVSVPDPSPS